MVNRIKVAATTEEQIEYDESMKNFRIATAKIRLHQNGINSSEMSQQVIDKTMRIFDDMDHIQKDAQQKTSKIQHDKEVEIQKISQDANKKYMEIQGKFQDLINSLKEDKKDNIPGDNSQVQDIVQANVETEKSHEEKVNEITDIVLKYMENSIKEKVSEIMSEVDKKAEDIIANDSKLVV